MTPAALVLAFVTLQRGGELLLARRNTAALLARGGREVGAGHYPLIVALHAAWLGVLGQPPDGWLRKTMSSRSIAGGVGEFDVGEGFHVVHAAHANDAVLLQVHVAVGTGARRLAQGYPLVWFHHAAVRIKVQAISHGEPVYLPEAGLQRTAR